MSLGAWVRVRARAREDGGSASGSGSDSTSVSFSASESVDFELPEGHTPYMVLPKGGSGPFSCANCVALLKDEDGNYHCKSPQYGKFFGDTLLKDEKGKPLDDPSRACSDWFTPKE